VAATQLQLPESGPVTKVVTAFAGTEHELRFEIDVVGWHGHIVDLRRLPGNRTDATPVTETR